MLAITVNCSTTDLIHHNLVRIVVLWGSSSTGTHYTFFLHIYMSQMTLMGKNTLGYFWTTNTKFDYEMELRIILASFNRQKERHIENRKHFYVHIYSGTVMRPPAQIGLWLKAVRVRHVPGCSPVVYHFWAIRHTMNSTWLVVLCGYVITYFRCIWNIFKIFVCNPHFHVLQTF